MKIRIKSKIFYLIITFSLLIFLVFTFSMNFIKDTFALFIIKNIYQKVCHQIESRCFLIDGKPMLICSRCTGIYLGSLILFFILTVSQRFRKYLDDIKFSTILIFALPLLIEWSLNFLFKIETTNFVRFLTGFFTSFIPVYLLNHLIMNSSTYD